MRMVSNVSTNIGNTWFLGIVSKVRMLPKVQQKKKKKKENK